MKDKVYAVGIDLGNGFTNYLSQKTGQGQRFATRVKQVAEFTTEENNRKEVHYTSIDGVRYEVGRGVSLLSSTTSEIDLRINSNEYKVALLTAIAKSLPRAGYSVVNVCLGLPISRLQSHAKELESIIMSYGETELTVDGELYGIKIASATVFAEGAISFIEDIEEGSVLVIDMGSGTLDCVEFEDGEPSDKYTLETSMNDIYATVANRLSSSSFNMKVNADSIEKYIGKEEVSYRRKMVNISAHFEDIRSGVNALYNKVVSRFPNMDEYNRVIMIGGASILTFKYWEELIPGVELAEDAQYVNAKVFQAVAESNVA